MKKIMVIAVSMLFVTACNFRYQTHDCVKQISLFVEEQKEICADYAKAEWNQANLRFLELLIEANKYNDDLSTREKLEITRASTTYLFLQMDHVGSDVNMNELIEINKTYK